MYRIPGAIGEEPTKKPAILLMHAQDADMKEWIINESDKAIAFILVRAGFDVWLGNNRGSSYGLAHTSLDRTQKEFWNFYQEEMGLIDSPAFIDYILEATGLEKISYLGHSEGTTQFFLGASLNPDYYREKINLNVALAPCISTVNMGKNWSTEHMRLLELIVVDTLKYYNWFSPMPVLQHLVGTFCDILPSACPFLKDAGLNNMSRFDVFLSSFPSG